MALLLAMLSSLCFGMALVTGRVGLRTLDARSGAAISIPTATLLLAVAAPFAFHLDGFNLGAALLFAVVGLFFPAIADALCSSVLGGSLSQGEIGSDLGEEFSEHLRLFNEGGFEGLKVQGFWAGRFRFLGSLGRWSGFFCGRRGRSCLRQWFFLWRGYGHGG